MGGGGGVASFGNGQGGGFGNSQGGGLYPNGTCASDQGAAPYVTMISPGCGDPGCGLFGKHGHKGCGNCGGKGCGGCVVADPCNSCGGKGCGLCGGQGRGGCIGKGCGLCGGKGCGLGNLCKMCGGAGCAACAKAKGLVRHLLGHDKIKWFTGPGGPVPLTPGYTPYVNVTRSPRDFLSFPPFMP